MQQTILERVQAMNRRSKDGERISMVELDQLLADVEAALSTGAAERARQNLSYTEAIAMKAVADELPDEGGQLITSRIADRMGVTRSVVVNALRKVESAGVIVTSSMGMKGTMVRPLIPGWRESFLKAA